MIERQCNLRFMLKKERRSVYKETTPWWQKWDIRHEQISYRSTEFTNKLFSLAMESCVSVYHKLSSLLNCSSPFLITEVLASGIPPKFCTASGKLAAMLDRESEIYRFPSQTFSHFSLVATAPVLGRGWAPWPSVVFSSVSGSVLLDVCRVSRCCTRTINWAADGTRVPSSTSSTTPSSYPLSLYLVRSS